MDPRNLGERLEATHALDHLAQPVHRAVAALLQRGPIKDILHGVWLGHPLHPVLTDLPIGFWTSAFVLDLVGGRRARPAADALVGIGVAIALPTAAAGLADWSELNEPERRTGVVHALANVAATTLYGLSFLARRRGHRGRGIALGMAGATTATIGGFLGGHLTYRRAAGVNQAAAAPANTQWSEITVNGTLNNEKPTLAHLDGAPLAAVDADGGPAALYDRCSHLGGPLHEGDLVDGCVRCPWHGSTFRITDGTVVRGPTTATQPAYELRVESGRTEGRRRPPP
ncbi:MAG: Rieske 2Fe-2S domain-containing protein [Actinomycetota bacterium]|nr:Rieske 2Fe-2S domain-containing protein [Actinomycetota bacterium]